MTEYYGNTDKKRIEVVGMYEESELQDNTTRLGFLFKKGMLFDYALNYYYNGFVQSNKKGNIHPCANPQIEMRAVDSLERIEQDGHVYYVGNIGYEDHGGVQGNMYGIFKETAMISSDDKFNWKSNVKYDSYEATIVSGMFEFGCTYNASGDAYIEVRYTKCENKHRTKVNIGCVNVYYASNETILEAIDAWKADFKKNLEVA